MNAINHFRRARRSLAAGVLAGSLIMAGCSDLLDVNAESRVQAENLNDPGFAGLLVRSAIGDFECALAQYVMLTGTVADEFIGVHIYSSEAGDYDRRSVSAARQQYATYECGSFGAIYQPLSTAIYQADNALEKLTGWTDAQVPGRAQLIQQAQAYAGYGRVLLGEGFCTAAINLSAELTSDQVFAQAEALFTQAIAGPDATMANFARLGRARARRNLNNSAGALTDAQAIPAGFSVVARYSDATNRNRNEVFGRNNRDYGISVEAVNHNPTHMGVPDPRVRATNTGDFGPNGRDIVWAQQKYPTAAASIPIARYAEARLIIAELAGGQTAVNIINEFHLANGLPLFASVDPAAIRAHVIEERARELFLEGQRLWDIRRFDLPFNPPVGAPYPVLGGSYGTTRCFPLPDLERDNNPNIGSS
jgi:hypothetical protein